MRVKQWLDQTYSIPEAVVEATWSSYDDAPSLRETIAVVGRLVDTLRDRNLIGDDEVLHVLGVGWKVVP